MNAIINFDFERVVGKIKPMHGVGQPPIYGISDKLFHYLTEANIPFSRLHDVGGVFGGNRFVDICNIFRDFNADESLPESYDFAFTDILISSLIKHNVEPIFRLGETIENYHFIKAYRIFPPKDYAKWARICEHIIRHYNEGWANGFRYGIKYWEIWNEPENGVDEKENQMWHGTDEQFFELYAVTAKHLKAVFGDSIKVGGYASCGFRHILSDPERYGVDCEKSTDGCYAAERSRHFISFMDGFFDYIGKANAPLDFFSWHSYLTTEHTVVGARFLERKLKELGYEGVETHLNEWNNACVDMEDFDYSQSLGRALLGTGEAAARAASMMIAMQGSPTDVLCYYDARVGCSTYGGMFNPISFEPFPLYYSFCAFGELYSLGEEVYLDYPQLDGLYALAARGGERRAVMLANTTDSPICIETNLDGDYDVFAVDDVRVLDRVEVDCRSFTIPAYSVYLIKN